MLKYRCKVCNYFYNEPKEEIQFEKLSEHWECPACNASKEMFIVIKETENDENKTKIKHVFGIPGTSSLGIIEAIRKNKDIEYFQLRHEQTAALMALT